MISRSINEMLHSTLSVGLDMAEDGVGVVGIRKNSGEVAVEWFAWMEKDKDFHASEASLTANPGGTFFYAIWNQWEEDKKGNVFDSDAWFRRLFFDDDVSPESPDDGNSNKGKDKPKNK